MIIMIIFLISSVVFVIGTVMYLNYKKKNILSIAKQQSDNSITINRKNKTKKQLSDILQMRIKNNILCIGNRYSNIIKLGSIDYNMLSSNEQDSIENVLIQTALSIDYPIQFFSTTEYIDTSKVTSLIKKNKTSNLKIQEYKKYLTEYLENLMENRTISVVKNYAVISSDLAYENAIDELNRNSLSFKGSLLRAKIVCEILNEEELYNLIYRELNKNSALDISKLKEGGKNLYVRKKQKRKEKRN